MRLRDHLSEIKERLTKIESGLAEHIRRTAILEKKIAPLTKIYHFLQVLGALIIVTASISAIIRAFI